MTGEHDVSAIQHVVQFRWNENATPQMVDAFSVALTQLAESTGGLLEYRFGANVRIRDGGEDFAITALFENHDAMERYFDHPIHRSIVREFIESMVADKHSIQFAAKDAQVARAQHDRKITK